MQGLRFCLCVAAVFLCLTISVVAAERPNIVVILADDMGYSDLGCYGGEISTPNIDALAMGGLRFTQFYNAARCCPSRASLLTGLYPHQTGFGHMRINFKLPGYGADLTKNCVTIPEVLKTAGYKSYGTGKWHLSQNIFPGGSKENWPLQRGFDRHYGILGGGANYFDPGQLSRDNECFTLFTDKEYQPDGQFYLTDAISDHAIRYVKEHRANFPDVPFFMYVAYNAPHWPIHAPEETVRKYKGKYDAGYGPIREARLARMKELGLVPKDTELSSQLGDWNAVAKKDWEARCMEVYAAMIDRMDQGIGRIVDTLQRSGQYDNTVIFFLSDNGGCAAEVGRLPREDYPTRVDKPVYEPIPKETLIETREDFVKQTRDGFPMLNGDGVMPGPEDTFMAYGRAWANVSNTPFREYKAYIHEGGIATPLIVHAPHRMAAALHGTLCKERGHIIDLMSTCVELAGAAYPKEHAGHKIDPMEGVSLVPLFVGQPMERSVPLFWEHEGNRAIRDGKWKLVAKGAKGRWELYDIDADRSELRDLSAKYPEKVESLAKQWTDWAHRIKVYPWPWDAADPHQLISRLRR